MVSKQKMFIGQIQDLLELLIFELHKIDRLSFVWKLKTTTKPSFIILQKIYFMMNWSICHEAFIDQFW